MRNKKDKFLAQKAKLNLSSKIKAPMISTTAPAPNKIKIDLHRKKKRERTSGKLKSSLNQPSPTLRPIC